MVYKKGPAYRVRPVKEICEDITEAHRVYGDGVQTLFFPAGNTIAMPEKELSYICLFATEKFPSLKRITVYGSSQYIVRKGPQELRSLRMAGLSRIHVGLESGDDEILRKVKKGATASEHVAAGRFVKEAGIELSEYVVLGLGGLERTKEHIKANTEVLNAIEPDFVRLRPWSRRSIRSCCTRWVRASQKISKPPTPANAGVGVDADCPISGIFQFPPVRHVQKDSVAGFVDTERLSFLVNMRNHHFRHFAGIRRKAPLAKTLFL